MRELTKYVVLTGLIILVAASVAQAQLPGATCTGSGGVNCTGGITDFATTVSTFPINDPFCNMPRAIGDVNVGVDLRHTFLGDLVISVTSPAGTVVQLQNSVCGTANDEQAVFDDTAGAAIGTVCPPAGFASYMPVPGALAALAGEAANGTWTLAVQDVAGADQGNLVDWSVQLSCSTPVPGISPRGGALLALLLLLAMSLLAMRSPQV